jgi:hypothetical protein
MPKTNSTTIERITMNVKHVLAIAAVLTASQAFSMTDSVLKHSCPPDSVGCVGGVFAGGGAADSIPATLTEFYVFGDMEFEVYSDSQGGFAIVTDKEGNHTVVFGGKSAPLIKPPPPKNQMSRSKLVLGAFTQGQSLEKLKEQAAARGKAKAELEAGAKAMKAAADKAFQDKMAAQDAADNQAAADKAKAEAAKKALDAANRTRVMSPVVAAAASSPRMKP